MAGLDRRVAVDDGLVILCDPSRQTFPYRNLQRREQLGIRTGDMHWYQEIATALVNGYGVVRHDRTQAGSKQRQGLVQAERIPQFLNQLEHNLSFLPGTSNL